MMLDVFDRFLGGGSRDWSADLLKLYADREADAEKGRKAEEAKRVPGTSPALPLASYAGAYADPLRGEVVVALEGGRRRATYGTAFAGPLEHWHFETFRARWDAAWRGSALITFVLDAAGRPSRLEAFGARFTRAPAAPS